MRWLLFGALLGVLLLVPSVTTLAAAAVGWAIGQPVLMAFVLGAVARPHLPRMRRWAR